MTKESLAKMTDSEILNMKGFLKNSWKHSEHTTEFKETFKRQVKLLNEEISDSRIKIDLFKIEGE